MAVIDFFFPVNKNIVMRTNRGRQKDSQLQDEDDLGLVLEDLVQRDDVGVLDFLQDAHLTLDVFPCHPPSTRLAAPLLDELGGVFHACVPVPASSDHCELTAERKVLKMHLDINTE